MALRTRRPLCLASSITSSPEIAGNDSDLPRLGLRGRTCQSSDLAREAAAKGPISLLQEFLQCAKDCKLPNRRPLIQWTFETRMATFSTLQFRATAMFLLHGVPHCTAGTWLPSKKAAQRDAAERALVFFIGRWGEHLVSDSAEVDPHLATPSTATGGAFSRRTSGEFSDDGGMVGRRWSGSSAEGSIVSRQSSGVTCIVDDDEHSESVELHILDQYCRSFQFSDRSSPHWSFVDEGGQFAAVVTMEILGVPHTFRGPLCANERQALTEACRRVLWYLQCPGFEDAFEPDAALCTGPLAEPPAHWASNASERDALEAAERKTAVMRVQNRLQQAFSQALKPGQSVWEWSFEVDKEDTEWPQLCRAKVRLAVLDVEFVGDWVRGHRGAQRNVCAQVAQHLDQLGFGLATRVESQGPLQS